jgi:hypothetical protein
MASQAAVTPSTATIPTSPDDRPVPNPSASSDSEARLVATVRDLFQYARDKRRPLVSRWNNAYKALHDVQYSTARAGVTERPEVTEIFAVLDAIVSWVTDQKPQFYASPFAEPYSPFYDFHVGLATDMVNVLEASWYNHDFDSETEKIVWDGYTYGVGFSKITWNQSLLDGMGDWEFRRCDPYSMYWDPDATSEKDWGFVIEAKHMSMQAMERRWPGSLAKVNFGSFEDHDKAPNVLDPHNARPHERMTNPGAIAPATTPRWGLPGQAGRVDTTGDPGITVLECWLRTPVRVDDADNRAAVGQTEDRPEQDPTPSDRAEAAVERAGGAKRTFDSWRCVVMAGGRILFDETAAELWSHSDQPYRRFVPAETGEFVGPSLVEKLAPLQDNINRTLGSIQHNVHLMGNPILIDDLGAGLDRTPITNRPGLRLTKSTANSQVQWLQPPQIHPQMSVDLIRFYIDEMERISGLSAVVRGASPSGRNAQGVIDSVSEAAFVRIRKSIRNLNRMLRVQINKAAAIVAEFYDEPRIVTIAGDTGYTTALALRGQHFYTPTPEGRLPLRFSVRLDVDSSLPTSRQARIAEAMSLYGMGGIDREALLEAVDFPGRVPIVARMRELEAMAAQTGPTQRQAAGH